ncbi:MAG: LacI family DNA-binding transcriptional regulator [Pseudomonadota bacterium]
MSKITITDVARRANVSIKTVSRVVNGEPNVRDGTRERVQQAILDLDYRPNPSARSLATQRSYLVALIYDDPDAYEAPSCGYVVNLQQGLLAACNARGFDLLIHPANYRDPKALENIAKMIAHARPEGVVLAAPLSNMPDVVATIEDSGTRLIRLSPGPCATGQFVETDDAEAAQAMTSYLASLGHSRIAFVRGHAKHAAVQLRLSGYKAGLRAAGLDVDPALIVDGDNSIASGENAAAQLLALEQPPTAIFAANDDMAAGILRTASRFGVSVPEQLSVAGFDDISLAQQIYPALTTVRQPLHAIAYRAGEMIIDNVQGAHEDNVIPAEIVVRESTAPLARQH